MKLNELLEPGDIINTSFYNCHYVVTGNEAWNRVTNSYDEFSDGSFGYDSVPAWIKSIVRGTGDITNRIRTQLKAVEFRFGDRVVNSATPKVEGIFLKYTVYPFCDVAYKDPDDTVVQSTHVDSIRHAD